MDLNLDPAAARAKRRQMMTVVAAMASVALLLTLVSKSWLRAGGGYDAGIGLIAMYACRAEGECESQINKTLIDEHNAQVREARAAGYSFGEERTPVFWITGLLTVLFGVLTVASLIAGVIRSWQDKFFVGPLVPSSLALLFAFLALVTGCIFVATNPTRGTALQLGVGWAFWLFGIAVVAAIVAAQMLAKLKPTVEPTYLE